MTAREILDRIYAGRHQLRKLHGDPDLNDVQIIMSNELYAALMVGCRDDDMARNIVHVDYGDYTGSAVIKIWNMPTYPDSSLKPNEIRFRSEVTL